MREKLTIVGPCSKYVDGWGWTTEIPVEKLNKAGYFKVKDCIAMFKKHGGILVISDEYPDGRLYKFLGDASESEKFKAALDGFLNSDSTITAYKRGER